MKCERVTTMKNQEIAQLLYEIADFLEIEDVEYKPRAYRTAARNVESLSEPVEDVYERGELEAIDGVGESIAEKIADYLETGQLAYYEELKADLPIDIEAITSVSGVGPKTAKKLYFELGVTTLEDLERAADAGEIAPLEGFGEKSQQSILDHVERAKRGQERMLLGRADPIARELETRLQSADEFERVDIVGSFRRRRPTVGDLDVLATAPNPEAATDVFCTHDDVTEVLARGETKSSVVVSGDLQVDLRIVDEREYGAALVYFTGSKDHNIALRNRAIDRDWKLNEYGLFDVGDGDDARGDDESANASRARPRKRSTTHSNSTGSRRSFARTRGARCLGGRRVTGFDRAIRHSGRSPGPHRVLRRIGDRSRNGRSRRRTRSGVRPPYRSRTACADSGDTRSGALRSTTNGYR